MLGSRDGKVKGEKKKKRGVVERERKGGEGPLMGGGKKKGWKKGRRGEIERKGGKKQKKRQN